MANLKEVNTQSFLGGANVALVCPFPLAIRDNFIFLWWGILFSTEIQACSIRPTANVLTYVCHFWGGQQDLALQLRMDVIDQNEGEGKLGCPRLSHLFNAFMKKVINIRPAYGRE